MDIIISINGTTIPLIVDALIGVFNAGIPDLIFASGKIKWYQIIVNTMFLLSVVAAYFVLQAGAPAYYLQVTTKVSLRSLSPAA